jgi:hypothetical protein
MEKYRNSNENTPGKRAEVPLRKEFTGHLWNHWLGLASGIDRALRPLSSEVWLHDYGVDPNSDGARNIRTTYLVLTLQAIQGQGTIPKVDVLAQPEDRRDAAKRYNDLTDKVSDLCVQILEATTDISRADEDLKNLPEISDNHIVFSLLRKIKETLTEVNEILYNKPCEFFEV